MALGGRDEKNRLRNTIGEPLGGEEAQKGCLCPIAKDLDRNLAKLWVVKGFANNFVELGRFLPEGFLEEKPPIPAQGSGPEPDGGFGINHCSHYYQWGLKM